MRIPRIKIADTIYSLNESIIDAHISLGRWHILDAQKFEIQYRKAYKLLGKSGGLHVKARRNLAVPDLPDGYQVYQFHVASPGAKVMESLEQMLSAGQTLEHGLHHRAISPPGPVFHLSVRV